VTPQSETDLVDKSGRSTVATSAATGTERSSKTGRDAKSYVLSLINYLQTVLCCIGWLRGPAVEHRSLAGVLSLSCVRLVADG